jgi:hypothetical protein
MAEVTFEIDADLVTDICSLVRARSKNPMEGLVALVGSILMIKAMYLQDTSDETLSILVGDLMKASPKIVRAQDSTTVLN